MLLNKETTWTFIDKFWDDKVIPSLSEFVTIPCKTQTMDPDWQKNKYLQKAAELFVNWFKTQDIPNLKVKIVNLEGCAPLVFAEIPASGNSDKTVMFYSHLDKMPESEGWKEGLEPWKPVLKGDHLYGRGSVDDGYAAYLPITAIKALHAQGKPHARCVILIEGAEECGSIGFTKYLDLLKNEIGQPDLIICADAGGENYDQLWNITSLRGLVNGNLRVEVSTMGAHSGSVGGIIPSSMRIMRQLLSRIEDEKTGEILLKEAKINIPKDRLAQLENLAKVVGDKVYKDLPFVPGAKPVTTDVTELLLNKNWRPTLEIIAAEGFPTISEAGHTLRPTTTFRLSMRLPPSVDATKVADALKTVLEKDPPYGAKVEFNWDITFMGWNAPATKPWLEKSLEEVSTAYFGNKPAFTGEGGSIGVIQQIGERYPSAQFIITGLLGPDSNAHGPNEALLIPAAKKLNCCVAEILAMHQTQ